MKIQTIEHIYPLQMVKNHFLTNGHFTLFFDSHFSFQNQEIYMY